MSPWNRRACGALLALACAGGYVPPAMATSPPPAWLMAQVNAAMPEHDPEADAVVLYSSVDLLVKPDGTIRHTVRMVYRILRAEGERRGVISLFEDSQSHIDHMSGWSIPASGKALSVDQRDAVTGSPVGNQDVPWVSYASAKVLRIPGSAAGSVIGFEYEQNSYSYLLADRWSFQDTVPVREAHYSVTLPAGWRYKADWINHEALTPIAAGTNSWQWTLTDIKGARLEKRMPPWQSIAGRLDVSLLPLSNATDKVADWTDVARWYDGLVSGRRESSPAIAQKVRDLTASETTTIGKMRALAGFVQSEVRYVAIELGIGGYQPHLAADIYSHLYGDCKDKATLLSTMLKEIGIESYYVMVNAQRGMVDVQTPASPLLFNHVILAIKLPTDVADPAMHAVVTDSVLGRLLIFDPTNPYVPVGALSGNLQGNYGLLTTGAGGTLTKLPQLSSDTNMIERNAHFDLNTSGGLSGTVHEVRSGDRAAAERNVLERAAETDRIKPVEALMANSFPTFELSKATVGNLHATARPLEWSYDVVVEHYAKQSGELLMIRPRVLGSKASSLLETSEPRRYAIEFDASQLDTDDFEINLPDGYTVDELPPEVRVDYPFASYHSKTELVGHMLKYTRRCEIRNQSVSADQADQLRKFYRTIETDERMIAVLKKAAP